MSEGLVLICTAIFGFLPDLGVAMLTERFVLLDDNFMFTYLSYSPALPVSSFLSFDKALILPHPLY